MRRAKPPNHRRLWIVTRAQLDYINKLWINLQILDTEKQREYLAAHQEQIGRLIHPLEIHRISGKEASNLITCMKADRDASKSKPVVQDPDELLGRSWDPNSEELVTCPECGEQQNDMGYSIACEACGHIPMPTRMVD